MLEVTRTATPLSSLRHKSWPGRPRPFTLLLCVVSVLMLAASFYTSLLIRERQQALSQISRYNVTWVTSQAALELARLEAVVAEYALGGRNADPTEAQMRLDIVANRVQILAQGEAGELIHSQPELQAIYAQLKQNITTAEGLVDSVDQDGVPAKMLALISPLNAPLAKLASAAHDAGGNLVAQDLKQLSALHWAFSGMLIALILCCVGLIGVLVVHNGLLQRAHAEVGNLVAHLQQTGHDLAVANEEIQQQNRILKERDVRLDLQNTRFDTALNNMSQALCMVGPDDRLIVCNRPFRELFQAPPALTQTGARASELFAAVIAHARETTGDDLVERIWREQQSLIAGRRASGYLMEMPDGRALGVSHQPMADGGWVATYADITDLRLAERQLVQAQKMEAIGNLTGGMAHDFNNLLAVISLNLEFLLTRSHDDPRVQEPAGRALRASLRGADLISQLLAFARRQPLAPQRIGVNRWISSIATLLEHTLGEDISIQLRLGSDIWPVNADATRLETAIANLCTNARDAMPAGGKVTITTSNCTLDPGDAVDQAEVKGGDYVMIEVADTGTGMMPDVAARIFEPFFTTKEEGHGTGLGLSMVFGFIRQSGGHITLDSVPGKGTTFRLYLPRAEGETGEKEAAPQPPSAIVGGDETILLVEDNEAVRQVTADLLGMLGYTVIATESPQEALRLLRAGERVDLLFSDVVMPGGIDGFALVDEAVALRPGLKVLLASGFAEADVAPGSPSAGVRMLAKPFRQSELARVVREIFDSQEPPRAEL